MSKMLFGARASPSSKMGFDDGLVILGDGFPDSKLASPNANPLLLPAALHASWMTETYDAELTL